MQHRAVEAEFCDAAFEFVCAFLGVVGRHRGECAKPLGMLLDGLVQAVVDTLRHLECDFGGKVLRRGSAMRDDLIIDAGFVHFLQPEFAEVVEALFQRRCPHNINAPVGADEFLVPVMFLKCDDLWSAFLNHGVTLPRTISNY